MLVCPKCGSVYTRSLEFCGLDGARLIETLDDPLLGRTIDRYRVDQLLGAGGMARVYRAHHLYLEQDMAVKVLHGEIASDKELARRFHREAKALSRIRHENVVHVADFGATPEGLLFMVMEYLDGIPLFDLLQNESPLHPPRAAAILRQICLGLQVAHTRGYVHRDLKPGNIVIIQEDGREIPKILDFGLVRILETEDTQLTAAGQFFGTPLYMSPEQITGEPVGPTSDLYALGVILFQMLVGNPPFEGDVKQLTHQHVSTPPPRPRLEYGGLRDILLDLLEKEPKDRPADAKTVVNRIDELTIAPMGGPPRPRSKSSRSRRPAPADAEVPMLSQPVLAEERSYRQTTQSDEEDIRHLTQAALGMRAHFGGRLPLILILAGLLAVAGYFWKQGEPPNLAAVSKLWSELTGKPKTPDETKTPGVSSPPPPATRTEPPAARAVPPPKPPVKKRRSPTRTAARPPPPKHKAPPPPPPEPAPPPVTVADYKTKEPPPDAGPPPSYKDLDLNLGWLLTQRGLSWADLKERLPQETKQWSRWYRDSDNVPAQDLRGTFETLAKAAESIPLDRNLLTKKQDRVRDTLGRLNDFAGDPGYDNLQSRYAELSRDLSYDPLLKPIQDLVMQLTLLDSDVSAYAAKMAKRPPPAPAPEPAAPEPAETATTS